MVSYLRIEYSTYQFWEESKGGGLESTPPPWSLRYRKKRGTERVNELQFEDVVINNQYFNDGFFCILFRGFTSSPFLLSSMNSSSKIPSSCCRNGNCLFNVNQVSLCSMCAQGKLRNRVLRYNHPLLQVGVFFRF